MADKSWALQLSLSIAIQLWQFHLKEEEKNPHPPPNSITQPQSKSMKPSPRPIHFPPPAGSTAPIPCTESACYSEYPETGSCGAARVSVRFSTWAGERGEVCTASK